MTNTLYDAFQENTGVTANGGKTQVSSLDNNVDFFFLAGASRGKDITSVFKQALLSNADVAIRTLLWARDVRGGAGERQLFRDCLVELENSVADPSLFYQILEKVPELGRWDDLLVVQKPESFAYVSGMIELALDEGNGLCAKWMPRKGRIAAKLREHLGLSPKNYRKLIVNLSKTVEQKMCANEWKDINYEHVPSVAAARYQRAFSIHDPEGYEAYRESLASGEAKVNAGAVYPYDVVKSVFNGDEKVACAQWDALPNFMEGCEENILPMVDVSGSMGCPAGGWDSNSSVTCMDVAISLGIYVSERNEGIFKDQFLSFTRDPQLWKLKGNLVDRINAFRQRGTVGYNTDIEKAFRVLLKSAEQNRVPQDQMPDKLLILSDMEFDASHSISGTDMKSFEIMEELYSVSGYKLPQIIFWNLNGRMGNVPVSYHKTGTALVSGFSPSLMKSLLGGEDITPEGIMLKTVMDDRYNY